MAKKSNANVGLTDEKVRALRRQFGRNEVAQPRATLLRILARQIVSPFVVLLAFAAALAFVLGEVSDAVLVLFFLLVNTVIGFGQEWQATRTLTLLQKYTAKTTTVRRNNKDEVIPVAELVPGDIVAIQVGDIVPADVQLLQATELQIDESVLTGESASVAKSLSEDSGHGGPDDDKNRLCLAGTTVVSGHGEGIVIATGVRSAMGKLTQLSNQTSRPNQLQNELSKITEAIFGLAFGTLALLFILHVTVLAHTANSAQSTGEFLLFFVALLIGITPEALPVVMTFAYAQGAQRLAKYKVVVKHLQAVEELGNVDVLCSDKTGTLTENSLRVHEVHAVGEHSPLVWALAASKNTYHRTLRQHLEPFDTALVRELEKQKVPHAFVDFVLLDTLPFDPHRRTLMALVEYRGQKMVIVRGAPEVVLEMCQPFARKAELYAWEKENGRLGYRSFAVAYAPYQETKPTKENSCGWDEPRTDYTLIGAVSFVDPLRATATASIQSATRLGVAVKILTGDSAAVAGYIGEQVGLIKDAKEVFNGRDFDALSAEEKKTLAEKMAVFARVTPAQKHEIIQLLQKNNHTVGYVGDGINDAPALKQAHVGLTVAGASDIAQEAADIILLHRSLDTIVTGIEQGRIIFANVLKYIRITLSSTLGNFFTLAVASLLLPVLPMLPVQILLLNVLVDLPMIAIGGDHTDAVDVQRPQEHQPLPLLLWLLVFGTLNSMFDGFFLLTARHLQTTQLQTSWFLFNIVTEFVVLLSLRSHLPIWCAAAPSRLLAGLIIGVAMIACIFPFTIWGDVYLHFAPITWQMAGIIAALAFTFGLVNELAKRWPPLTTAYQRKSTQR